MNKIVQGNLEYKKNPQQKEKEHYVPILHEQMGYLEMYNKLPNY